VKRVRGAIEPGSCDRAVVGFVILGEELEFRAITAVLLVTVVTVGASRFGAWLQLELMKVKMKPVWSLLPCELGDSVSRDANRSGRTHSTCSSKGNLNQRY